MGESLSAAERKAAAEAESAELDRDKKKLELEEWKQRGAQRDAEADASIRTAAKDMTPDLSGVDRGSTTLPESGTIFQALLGGRALQDAASEVARSVKSTCGDNYRVLVTTDLDLAARDAPHLTAIAQLERLQRLIVDFLKPPLALGYQIVAPLTATKIATAAAKLLPGLISLISAKRTISTSSGTVDDATAMIAVAGALALADPGAVVVVDQARLLTEGGAVQAWTELDASSRDLGTNLENLENQQDHDKDRLAAGKKLLDTVRAALTAMTEPSAGGGPSALATATLQEALHGDEFQAVLIIKGGAASATQLVDDRPLRFADPLSIVSTATIAYLLIRHRDESKVRAGGLAHGAAQIRGKIGDWLELPTSPAWTGDHPDQGSSSSSR